MKALEIEQRLHQPQARGIAVDDRDHVGAERDADRGVARDHVLVGLTDQRAGRVAMVEPLGDAMDDGVLQRVVIENSRHQERGERGIARAASSASMRTRANSGSLRPSPNSWAVEPCAMITSCEMSRPIMLPRSAGSAKRGGQAGAVGGLAPAAIRPRSRSSGQIPAVATSRIADDTPAAGAFIDRTANAKPAMGNANRTSSKHKHITCGICGRVDAKCHHTKCPICDIVDAPSGHRH